MGFQMIFQICILYIDNVQLTYFTLVVDLVMKHTEVGMLCSVFSLVMLPLDMPMKIIIKASVVTLLAPIGGVIPVDIRVPNGTRGFGVYQILLLVCLVGHLVFTFNVIFQQLINIDKLPPAQLAIVHNFVFKDKVAVVFLVIISIRKVMSPEMIDES